MSFSDYPCFFHPYQRAIDKCEKCGKKICLDCKNVYSTSHSSPDPDPSKSYLIKTIYCPTCYKFETQRAKKQKIIDDFICIIGTTVILTLMLVMWIVF